MEELADPSLVRLDHLSAILCDLICHFGRSVWQLTLPAAECMRNSSLCSNMLSWSGAVMQKDKPMAVGGLGMISTANYVARKYGVRSAMPGKLCAASWGQECATMQAPPSG